MSEEISAPRRPARIVHLHRWLARLRWSDATSGLAVLGGKRPSLAQILEFSLVLTARGIPNRVRTGPFGGRLLVRGDRLDEARAEISAYVRENSGGVAPSVAAPPRFDNTRATLTVLICLGAFFSLTGADVSLGGSPIDWLGLGAGDSRAILAGQWWRLATALTLHADAAHMAGNLILGGVFLIPLCREIGTGPGCALALASGLAGNLLKVLIQGPGQHFIGASTAVFGAVGVLGALLAARGPRGLSFRRLAPAGAALMFLAFLGSGSDEVHNIDLAGHFSGFVCGVLLGLTGAGRLPRPGNPKPGFQAAMAILTAAALPAAWIWALVRG
jgi:membrane associated rhomboid family serine protease